MCYRIEKIILLYNVLDYFEKIVMAEETSQGYELSLSKIGQGNELILNICIEIEQHWISPTKKKLIQSDLWEEKASGSVPV